MNNIAYLQTAKTLHNVSFCSIYFYSFYSI